MLLFALFACFGGTIGPLNRLDYEKHVIIIDYGKQTMRETKMVIGNKLTMKKTLIVCFVCLFRGNNWTIEIDYGKHVITIDYGKQDDEEKNGYRKQVEVEKLLNNVRNNIWTMRNYFRIKSTTEIMCESVADYREQSLLITVVMLC